VPLSLLICPVAFDKSRSLASHPLAIILIAKSEAAEKTNLLQLREDYSLTAAEARFAIEIIAGDGIQAAADRLSISKATARTHLSRIFHKTGTRRQAELVRMLISRSKIR
jgi:DNA-binding CsgD family transcriptional regulator